MARIGTRGATCDMLFIMPLCDLNEADRVLMKKCLDCVASGTVILHDWEFHTIMGVDPDVLIAISKAWPVVNDADPVVACAVNNSLNNLLGYPHHAHEDWDTHISVPRKEVERLLALWRGRRPTSYLDGPATPPQLHRDR